MTLRDFIKANGIEGFTQSFKDGTTGKVVYNVNDLNDVIDDAEVAYSVVDFDEKAVNIVYRVYRSHTIRIYVGSGCKYYTNHCNGLCDFVSSINLATSMTKAEAKKLLADCAFVWLCNYEATGIEIVRI